jgi:hypothetical protein
MVAIHLSAVPQALDAPEDTKTKLGRAFDRRINWDRVREQGAEERGKARPEVKPALDFDAINAANRPEAAYAPQWHMASFRIPLGTRMSAYEKRRDEAAATWVNEMMKEGYRLCTDSRITAKPGPYPAIDLHSGLALLGEREVHLFARFVHDRPEIATFELPAEWFARPDR